MDAAEQTSVDATTVLVLAKFLCQISVNTRPDTHPNMTEPRSPGGKISLPLTGGVLTA